MINLVILDDEYNDNQSDHQKVWQKFFSTRHILCNVVIYSSPDSLLKEIDKFTLNTVLILDLDMPEKNGLDVLHEIREKHIHIPIIIYSGTIDSSKYDRMAIDNSFTYIEKSHREELAMAVKGAMELLEEAIPLELSVALEEYLNRRPERKHKEIHTKDGQTITFQKMVDEINSNSIIGIDYQKALYKMGFEALLDGDKKL